MAILTMEILNFSSRKFIEFITNKNLSARRNINFLTLYKLYAFVRYAWFVANNAAFNFYKHKHKHKHKHKQKLWITTLITSLRIGIIFLISWRWAVMPFMFGDRFWQSQLLCFLKLWLLKKIIKKLFKNWKRSSKRQYKFETKAKKIWKIIRKGN